MNYDIQEAGPYRFIETRGSDEPLLLLHGLFGALSNFGGILDHFGSRYNVVIPILPIYTMPFREVGLKGLVEHIEAFVDHQQYARVHVLGNSLGGHIALLYALACPQKVASITLTGSSGLFESAMGGSFPKRGNYAFIREKTAATFYNPEVATKELVDEVFDIVNDRHKGIRVVVTAKSAVRHNLKDKLQDIHAPTLLLWGANDTITPPFVGQEFHRLIADSRLHFIEACGHAPMMEYPAEFNRLLEEFLEEVTARSVN